MAHLADAFIANLEGADAYTSPYRHWILKEVVPAPIAQELNDLEIPMAAGLNYGGQRALNDSLRAFFDTQRQAENPTIAAFAETFRAPETIAAIETITDCDLTGSLLRIEYCQDGDGFWLERHTDIGAKLFTFLVYLTVGEGSDNCGTDIFDDDGNLVKSAAFKFNTGLIFVPANNTWHGFNRRKINGVRKTIIINYVKPEWRARHELAFDTPVK